RFAPTVGAADGTCRSRNCPGPASGSREAPPDRVSPWRRPPSLPYRSQPSCLDSKSPSREGVNNLIAARRGNRGAVRLDRVFRNGQRPVQQEEPPMRNSHIEIAPIAGALGAEIGGVDVAQDLDDAVIREIRQALLDYGVIFFRGQKLERDQHKAFT